MKKIRLNIEDLFNVPTAVIYSPDYFKTVDYVTIDSRKVKKNSLFIAIKGKRLDGHDFVTDAIRNGAVAAVINENKIGSAGGLAVDIPLITVKNTTRALGEIAKIWRKKLNAKVVAVTGSSGKTTVKEMIAGLLSERYSVSKTENNNNNHIGVPLTILNTNGNHQVLVAELGTNHFGEIPYTAGIISPDYSLITNIGEAHIEFLKDKKGVWKEKSSLFDETIKNNGKIFINTDDLIIKKYKSGRANCFTFGSKPGNDLVGRVKNYTGEGRPTIELVKNRKRFSVQLPLYGEQSANNFIAAAAVALGLGIANKELLRGAARLKMPAGRMNLIRSENFILIDDTYNANPDSMKAAIEFTARVKIFKRKILLLGDMLELGTNEIHLHQKLAGVIKKTRIDEVFLIGKRMKYLYEKLTDENLIVRYFTKRSSLINHINKINLSNSVVLVKGSRKMKMEEFLSVLKGKADK